MKQLSAEAQQQMGAFMQSEAVRPLEGALYFSRRAGGARRLPEGSSTGASSGGT